METVARTFRDVVLIVVPPILVVMGIGWLAGDEVGGAWSAVLVGLGWAFLLWVVALRPAWRRWRNLPPSRDA